MEEIKEKSAKKPVSMRLTATASERLMHIIDLYKNLEDPKGEQQENAILRILDIAESDNIRGTHPELEGPLLPHQRFGSMFFLFVLETYLNSRIAVFLNTLNLSNYTRTSFDNSAWYIFTISTENGCHSDFLS